MDMATIAAKWLKREGKLKNLDESDEINACTVKTTILVDGEQQDWLVLFKNETHNHPTEIEPFGGAATCIVARFETRCRAARLSIRRCASPAPQTREALCRDAAGQAAAEKDRHHRGGGLQLLRQQIGLATGLVDEIYTRDSSPSAWSRRGGCAAPAKNVRREFRRRGTWWFAGRQDRARWLRRRNGFLQGAFVRYCLLLRRGGAKGNAPEERKLQRLFRKPRAALLIAL
jgi:phosphoribosylformylglycinamidine synthase